MRNAAPGAAAEDPATSALVDAGPPTDEADGLAGVLGPWVARRHHGVGAGDTPPWEGTPSCATPGLRLCLGQV